MLRTMEQARRVSWPSFRAAPRSSSRSSRNGGRMPWVRVESTTKVAIRVALAQAEAEGADVHIPRGVYDIDLTDEPPDTVGGPAIDVPPGVRRIFGDGADETVLRFRRASTAGYAQWSGLRILGPI